MMSAPDLPYPTPDPERMALRYVEELHARLCADADDHDASLPPIESVSVIGAGLMGIAIAAAQQLGVDPMPFVLAVLFGANMSFATPYGYQTNLLILSAGGYKFTDFLRVGIPLTIIMLIGFSLLLPALYAL